MRVPMNKTTIAVAIALSAAAGSISEIAAQTAAPLFDASLSTWQPQGSGRWRVENGELIGTSGGADGASWLMKRDAHQDLSASLAYRCNGCEAGILFRGQRAGDQVSGTYLALVGPDAGTLYSATFDAQGRVVERREIAKAGAPAPSPFDRTTRPDGYQAMEFALRGSYIDATMGATRLRRSANAPLVLADSMKAGIVALRVAGAPGSELRIKEGYFEDHTVRAALPPEYTAPGFRVIQVSDLYYGEGAAAADFNRDGSMDVISGPYIYLGPDYKYAREVYRATPSTMSGYSSNAMLSFAHDFTGDGWVDVLQASFGRTYLYVNPGSNVSQHWAKYTQMEGMNTETNTVADIDGDGRMDVLGGAGGRVGYWTVDPANPTAPWTFHPVSHQSSSDWGPHGYGVGDVNGDGRIDILQAAGWWERPTNPADTAWTYHKTDFGRGAEIQVFDVDGDGDNDVVNSIYAHGWGLKWFENRKDASGRITFTPHEIMGEWAHREHFGAAVSELHALAAVDMDGDGIKDIVTGKRWWSHQDVGLMNTLDQPELYWFKVSRQGGTVRFTPNLIHNNSGVGVQLTIADMNGDNKPDILTAARKGTFIVLNQR